MDYRLKREWRKSVKVEVAEGEVIVKAPRWLARGRIEAFLDRHRDWIEERLARWEEQRYCYFLFGERKPRDGEDVEALWFEAMRGVVVPLAWELARTFGDEPQSIKISRAKKRWGSCSNRKTINLSYRLAQLPPDLIEYVIIHELCHLYHMNHSKAFWALVRERCPDFMERKGRLAEFF